MIAHLLPVLHEAESRFSYECRACNRCCRGRLIQVNPFELIQLAVYLQSSTTAVRERWLDTSGAFIQPRDDGSCPFLTESGCSVHPARPLVCRLYPLGRLELADGDTQFVQLEAAAGSAGVYGDGGSIADYLASQDAPRFIDGERRYRQLFEFLTDGPAETPREPMEFEASARRADSDAEAPSDGRWILDPDPVIRAWAAARGITEPESADDRVDLHVEALFAWARGEWEPPATSDGHDGSLPLAVTPDTELLHS